MSKQTSYEKKLITAGETALRAGAWLLTATAMLAATEKLHHIDAHAPSTAHSSHYSAEVQPARAEGARETARLPEEYDVGLCAPNISGA